MPCLPCLLCPLRRGFQVALDVAEALAYLHEEARILHNDVKSA